MPAKHVLFDAEAKQSQQQIMSTMTSKHYCKAQQRQYDVLLRDETGKSKQTFCTAGGWARVKCRRCNDTWKCNGRRKHTAKGRMTKAYRGRSL